MSEYDYGPGPGKAIDALLDQLNLSGKQLLILKFVAENLARVGQTAAHVGELSGLSPQETLDATKAALAAFLAGLDAAPNLEDVVAASKRA